MLEFLRDTVGFYTIASAAGAAASLFVYIRLGSRRGSSAGQSVGEFFFMLAGLLAGAHLLFFLVGLKDWIADWAGQIHSAYDLFTALGYGASGLVFYGGLFGAYAGLLIFCKIYRLFAYEELCRASVVFPLFHAFGRIGCALNGCCYGIEYHGIFAICYTSEYINPGISDDIADFPRFPVQLLEAGLELLIFIFLLILYKKTATRYSVTCIYLSLYSVIRFFDEFLRGDAARKIWGPFSTSQWISLVLFAAVLSYLVYRQRKYPAKRFFAHEPG